MMSYFITQLGRGFRTSPLQRAALSTSLFLIFVIISLSIGMSTGLLKFEVIDSEIMYILPFALFVFPSMFEEIFFRGLIIPNNIADKGGKKILLYSLLSTGLFIIWHPLNALTINPNAQRFFLDPWFLVIVFVLGMVCSLGYIFSRSLWVPIIMHWLTVVAWVFLLGGRNLILD